MKVLPTIRVKPSGPPDPGDAWKPIKTLCPTCRARVSRIGDAEGNFFLVERRSVLVATTVPGLPGYVETTAMLSHICGIRWQRRERG